MKHNEYLSSIGMEVRVARVRKGLSIVELSKLTGLSKEGIGQLENGKSDFKILTLKRIADAMERPLNDFL